MFVKHYGSIYICSQGEAYTMHVQIDQSAIKNARKDKILTNSKIIGHHNIWFVKPDETAMRGYYFKLRFIMLGIGYVEVTISKNEHSCLADFYFRATNVK